MSDAAQAVEEFKEYRWGFVTDIEADSAPPGLNEDIIRFISAKKEEPEWLLQWRLKAYRAWCKMAEPEWAKLGYDAIDFQKIIYYSAPKQKKKLSSLDEVDPTLLEAYEKLGIPLDEQKRLAGVAVDAVFDSVSVTTTYKETLAEAGVIFCSFSEAVKDHPELVKKYLGTVVPQRDNFFAALNCAVFTDGSLVYIPEGVRCPMELSTYFRINAANTGQFERTLIIAEKGSHVSYLEGALRRSEMKINCTQRWSNSWPSTTPRSSILRYKWYPGDDEGRVAFTTLSPNEALASATEVKSVGHRLRQAQQ